MQAQLEHDEQAQIKQGQMWRAELSNNDDMASLEDIKNLSKLQDSGAGGQVAGLTEMAAADETTR